MVAGGGRRWISGISNKVERMLQILPHVMAEKIFVLKGGTAINFFCPRRSLIGANPDGSGEHWDGWIDEFKILDLIWSPAMVALSYENQKENQTLCRSTVR